MAEAGVEEEVGIVGVGVGVGVGMGGGGGGGVVDVKEDGDGFRRSSNPISCWSVSRNSRETS